MISLTTKAEKLAADAGDLGAFSGFSLVHVKRQVGELMRHIGENGIFDQYTRHDIAHVDSMLSMLEWLIPSDTQKIMTTADWLLQVLSIYFHDLGMLVSKDEYDSRNDSDYPHFRDTRLITEDDQGKDYRERIQSISADERERFLYQEFVRYHHATRIRHWIESPGKIALGSAGPLPAEIGALLTNLDPVFKSDLAKVCESHHAENLDNLKEYPLRQPYGNTAAEIANVQYAALILRTADLLQITRDRTPSITFRSLTPPDPVSQYEWAKHMAVRAVLPKLVRDRDDSVDEGAQSSVIEVHARFTDENGFFGLIGYLSYASQQLNQSYEWARESNRYGSKYTFPWRDIDTSNVDAVDFLPSQYEFKIDQAKILDLLTGHTLYNDTSVVIRELAQNSIDAVRLAFQGEASGAAEKGQVSIRWDSSTRLLEFLDNGVGMTQEVIENHFLRVGASLYQDPAFREKFPNFSPISRFGIGVLSAFMIADSVEVFTCHSDESKVRKISLRSVHGRYLIRLLDKESDEMAKSLVPHGTLVRLKVRASADIGSVAQVARRWFVLPGCNLDVEVKDVPVEKIGYTEIAEALKDELLTSEIITEKSLTDGSVEIRSVKHGEVSLAYGVLWSKWFRTWQFLNLQNASSVRGDSRLFGLRPQPQEPKSADFGMCVEGVRVEFDSPGYEGKFLCAIANTSGNSSPRTNVARSGLEDTPELTELIKNIYGLYCSHISGEIEELHNSRGRSATGASSEAGYLVHDLQSSDAAQDRVRLRSESAFKMELRDLPILLIEDSGRRRNSSLAELSRLGTFYTLEDPFIRTAEEFLRQLPADSSLDQMLSTFGVAPEEFPDGPLLVGAPLYGVLADLLYTEWQVSEILVNEAALRARARWTPLTDNSLWLDESAARRVLPFREVSAIFGQMGFRPRYSATLKIPLENIPVSGLGDYDAASLGSYVYLNPSGGFLAGIGGPSRIAVLSRRAQVLWYELIAAFYMEGSRRDVYGDEISIGYAQLKSRLGSVLGDMERVQREEVDTILECLPHGAIRSFNAYAGSRRSYLT